MKSSKTYTDRIFHSQARIWHTQTIQACSAQTPFLFIAKYVVLNKSEIIQEVFFGLDHAAGNTKVSHN